MGTNNRQRRKEKQARKKYKKKNIQQTKKNSTHSFNLQLINNPFANTSTKDRKIIFSELQTKAEEDYTSSLKKLQKLLEKYNPILIMSFLSNYYLMAIARDNSLISLSKENQINQSDVEILQALILKINPKKLKFEIPLGDNYQNIIYLLNKLSASNQFKNFKPEIFDLSEKDSAIRRTQEFVKLHTQIVRNWGNFEQVKRISSEIYLSLDSLLLSNYGFSSRAVIQIFNYLIRQTEKFSTKRFKNLQSLYKIKDSKMMMIKYFEIIDNDIEVVDKVLEYIGVRSQNEVFLWIMSHYDLRLDEQYTFSIAKVADDLKIEKDIVSSIVNQFSYTFGDLEDFKTEYIFLGNPIWNKPIILLSCDEFFCSLPQMFFSFILKSIDELVEKIDSKKLSEVKSEYLENKIEEIVKIKFPKINTIKSLKWEDDKEYETDLVTFIDSYIIIFEAKSGKITDEALRGAPDRLKKKINELLIEPNIQSKRLKNKLEYLIKNPEIQDKLRDKLSIDLSKIHHVLRVSITLEYFSTLQTNIYELKETGWIPDDYEPCPTMNIADFEMLFDILDHPVQIINYLEMREEFEINYKYKGDELDLIALYMENHLNLATTDPNILLNISGLSKKIDDYYESLNFEKSFEKPKVKMNKYFEKILIQVEDRKIDGWTKIGSVIYRLLPDDQLKIINFLKKIKNNVSKNWMKKDHENILNYVPPLSSEYAFTFAVYCEKNQEKRHEFIDEAMKIALEPEHVKYCLGIGINIDRSDLPYSLIYFSSKEIEE